MVIVIGDVSHYLWWVTIFPYRRITGRAIAMLVHEALQMNIEDGRTPSAGKNFGRTNPQTVCTERSCEEEVA